MLSVSAFVSSLFVPRVPSVSPEKTAVLRAATVCASEPGICCRRRKKGGKKKKEKRNHNKRPRLQTPVFIQSTAIFPPFFFFFNPLRRDEKQQPPPPPSLQGEVEGRGWVTVLPISTQLANNPPITELHSGEREREGEKCFSQKKRGSPRASVASLASQSYVASESRWRWGSRGF